MHPSQASSDHPPANVPDSAGAISPVQVRHWLLAGAHVAECRVTGPLAVRENSLLFYAESDGPRLRMAVKLCLRPRSKELDPEAALRQYRTLKRVHEAMGEGSEFSVPAPHAAIPEAALVATEWITGQNLARALFSWARGIGGALQLAGRSGRWLRRFHASRQLPPGSLDAGFKLEFLRAIAAERGVDDPLFREASACLQRTAEQAAVPTLPRSWVHGDFTADNLMVSGSRTIGMDIDVRHENTIVHDLAPFLNHLELHVFHPLAWRRWASGDALARRFLDAYFEEGRVDVAIPLAWLRLCMLLQTWSTAYRAAGSPLKRGFVHASHKAVASRLVRFLDAR